MPKALRQAGSGGRHLAHGEAASQQAGQEQTEDRHETVPGRNGLCYPIPHWAPPKSAEETFRGWPSSPRQRRDACPWTRPSSPPNPALRPGPVPTSGAESPCWSWPSSRCWSGCLPAGADPERPPRGRLKSDATAEQGPSESMVLANHDQGLHPKSAENAHSTYVC